MVNNKEIEANPEKIQALQDLKPLTNLKELQKLIGMAATLNRFISKCSDRCQPFFFQSLEEVESVLMGWRM